MGSLTDFFRYMQEDPKFLADTTKTLFHITPSEKMKSSRRILKLYDGEYGIRFNNKKNVNT
jgi:hypothetical protein